MYERIIEIIVYVIAELRQNKNINDIDVAELQDLGYTRAEISTAFSWLVDRVEFSEQFFSNQSLSHNASFRILHEAEVELFTREAWGELIQYQTLGIIGAEHVDSIIERAVMTGASEIGIKQLKAFVAGIIFNAQATDAPGSRVMLNGGDTIH